MPQDSNPSCLHSKELSRQVINNYSEHLHEASTWLPPHSLCYFKTWISLGCRPNRTMRFLHEKTVPLRRGHHYWGTWPPGFSPSFTTLTNKKIKFSSYMRKFRREQLQSHIKRKWGNVQVFTHIWRGRLSFLTAQNFPLYEESLIFIFLSV